MTDRGLAASPGEARHLYLRALLEHQVGEFEAGEAYLERMLEAARVMPGGATLAHAFSVATMGELARITSSTERSAAIREMAQGLLTSTSGAPIFPVYARQALALLAVQERDPVAARELCSFFAESGEPTAIVIVISGTDRRRLLGLLSATFGDFQLAAGHFEDSLVFCRKAGYRPALAWTCVDYAHMLLDQAKAGGPDAQSERAKATELLDEGLRIARELGMRPLVERALRDKEFLSA